VRPLPRWVLVGAGLALAGPAVQGCCARREPGVAAAAASVPPAPAEQELAVAAVRGSSQCGVASPAPWVRWLGEADAWHQALPQATIGPTLGSAPGASPAAAALDFEREGVVLIGMGERRTGGHTVELASPVARRTGRVAVVRVAFRSPAPGALVAQVITSPCLAVRLPRAGLDEVRVATEDGTVLGAAPLR